MEKTKKRSRNFSETERSILLDVVQQHLPIIENKKTNAVVNKEKQECWDNIIAVKFNQHQTTGVRSGTQLKTLYEQLKRTAKLNKANGKVERYKTGGGTFTSSLLDDKVLSILDKIFLYIDNRRDSTVTQNTDIPIEENVVFMEEDIKLPTITIQNELISDPLHINVESVSAHNSITEELEAAAKNLNHIESLHSASSCTSTDQQFTEENEVNINASPSFPSTSRNYPSPKAKKPKEKNLNKQKKFKSESRDRIYEKKLEILEIVKQRELENLKGTILDNEIKEIIKKREMLLLDKEQQKQ